MLAGSVAQVVELPPRAGVGSPQRIELLSTAELERLIADQAAPSGLRRRMRLDCPSTGDGIAVIDHHITGLGRGVARSLDIAGMPGGTSLHVTEMRSVRCRPAVLARGQGTDVRRRARLVCFRADVHHEVLEVRRGGRTILFPSYIEGRGWLLVWVTPEEAQRLAMELRFRGVDRGRSIRSPLVPRALLSPGAGNDSILGQPGSDPGPPGDDLPSAGGAPERAVLAEFSFEGGLDGYGAKALLDADLVGLDTPLDLTSGMRQALGENGVDVGPQEGSTGDCPPGPGPPLELARGLYDREGFRP